MTGRNEPCPCGSGRKYKHCCWAKARAEDQPPLAVRSMSRALTWLMERFRRQIAGAIEEEFFGAFSGSDAVSDATSALADEHRALLMLNIDEWVLCEAELERGDQSARAIDWVLDDGPRLHPDERQYLEALAAAPLRLYEVIALEPSAGIELRDVVDPSRPAGHVAESWAADRLAVGDMFGARLVRMAHHVELGASIHPLTREDALHVLDAAEAAFDDPGLDDLDAESGAPRVDDATLDAEIEAIVDAELVHDDEDEDAFDKAIADDIEDAAVSQAIRDIWLRRSLALSVRDHDEIAAPAARRSLS